MVDVVKSFGLLSVEIASNNTLLAISLGCSCLLGAVLIFQGISGIKKCSTYTTSKARKRLLDLRNVLLPFLFSM